MQPGAVIVDVSIDQGGCVETSRPTTHSDPTFEVDGIVHYCVANIPGAVPITSTHALTNAALLYVLQLADLGPSAALSADELFALGLKVAAGRVTYRPVADAQRLDYTPALDVLAELTHFVAAAW
jgi:alanine dehydrogenase